MVEVEGKQIKEWKDLTTEELRYYQAHRDSKRPDLDDIELALEQGRITEELASIMIPWIKGHYERGTIREDDWCELSPWLDANGYKVYSPKNNFGFDFFYSGDPSPDEWERYYCEPQIMDHMYFEDDIREGMIKLLINISEEDIEDGGYINLLESTLYVIYRNSYSKRSTFFYEIAEIVKEPITTVPVPNGYRPTRDMARLKVPYPEIDKEKLAKYIDRFYSDKENWKAALEAVADDVNGSYM